MTRSLILLLLLAGLNAGFAEEFWPTGPGACLDSPLRITFELPPVLGQTGKIEVCRLSDGQPVETIEVGAARPGDTFGGSGESLHYEPIWIDGNSAVIRLHTGTLHPSESYFVRVGAGVIQGFAGTADGWKFKTRPALVGRPHKITVAADGSADFCTVQGAVDAVEPHRTDLTVILIHKGRYHELVRIGRERPFIELLGEDRKETVITCTNNEKLNPGWIQRSVLEVEADDFVLADLTVQNTTPYKGSQAEAVCLNAERCVLREADFLSLQDTLNLSGRVYVSDSYIEGDVDYIWGYGAASFSRCELHSMHDGYIVQARNPPDRAGYLFLDCRLTAEPGVKKCWLARIETARFPASEVAFFGCAMGPHILPAGWQVTGPASGTLRFVETASTDLDGHPLEVSHRDPAGKQLTPAEAESMLEAWRPEER
jgi:pectin methylesterase-like acyl-CoA thioesterase